ncbi:hypothetical protein [Lacipirellula limnantheis]|nr:hypothetical protein [Lacipirellula limnantheis]
MENSIHAADRRSSGLSPLGVPAALCEPAQGGPADNQIDRPSARV